MSDMSLKDALNSMMNGPIWDCSLEARAVWMAMVAMADEFNHVVCENSALARRANIYPWLVRDAILEIRDCYYECGAMYIDDTPQGWLINVKYTEPIKPKTIGEIINAKNS